MNDTSNDKLKTHEKLQYCTLDHIRVWCKASLENCTEALGAASYGIALGFFDGVHVGHRSLIDQLLWNCQQQNLYAAVYTFDSLPKFFGSQNNVGTRIQTAADRADYLLSKGVEAVIEQPFTEEIRTLSPDEFIKYICKRLNIRYVVVGDDFRFGYEASGTAKSLQERLAADGIRVDVLPQIKGKGTAISSTRIRALLKEGKLQEANTLLGHPFSIRSEVIRGRGLARTWGMPTCNMRLPSEQLELPYGVYASRTRIGTRYYNSVSNIGLRPTVTTGKTDEKEPLLETFIFDLDADLYGEILEVYLLDFRRAESHFSKIAEMVEVMKADIQGTKDYLASLERLLPVGEAASIPYYHLATTRYRQSYLHFCIRILSDPIKNTARALAMRMVMQATKSYPTRQAFNLAKEQLYGASLDAYNDSEGNLQCFEFTAEAIAHGLHGERPFREAVSLLLDALQTPLLDDAGLFDEALFLSEKNNLLVDLRSRMQNKAKLAQDRSMILMLEGRLEGINPKGDLTVLEGISREDVSSAWLELLQLGQAEVYVAGYHEADFHDDLLNRLSVFTQFGRSDEPYQWMPRFVEALGIQQARKVTEHKELEQNRLVMYWTGLNPFPLTKGSVLNVFNSLFGADAHSLLFEKVREEHGLAYSIHSSALKYLAMIQVSAGINAGQGEKAIQDCRDQLAKIAEGDVSERHFKSSLAMVESKLLLLSDNLNGQLVYQMSALEAGHPQDSLEALEHLRVVSMEEVSDLAKSLKEVFVYQLLPNNSEIGKVGETHA